MNAVFIPVSQQSLDNPNVGSPVAEPSALVDSLGANSPSLSPPPTIPLFPTGWEAFREEFPTLNFLMMSESAKQEAYLESSMFWGQIGSDIFQGVKNQLRKWRVDRKSRKDRIIQESRKDRIIQKSITADAVVIPKMLHEEPETPMTSNFMNALLFAGPFNIMPGQDDYLGTHVIKLRDEKVEFLESCF